MINQPQNNDNLIATDLLLSAKNGVRNCAIALTEAASPEIRNTLHQQLDQAIQFHDEIYRYMENKGFYSAKDFTKQIQIDMQAVQQANQLQ